MDENFDDLIDRLLIETSLLSVRQSVLTDVIFDVFKHILSKEEYENLKASYADAIFSNTEAELKTLEGVVSNIRLIANEFLSNREARRQF